MGFHPREARSGGQETATFGPRSQLVQFGHRLASKEISGKHSGQSAGLAPSTSGVARAASMFIGLTIKK
jgi:hypothetical protein